MFNAERQLILPATKQILLRVIQEPTEGHTRMLLSCHLFTSISFMISKGLRTMGVCLCLERGGGVASFVRALHHIA